MNTATDPTQIPELLEKKLTDNGIPPRPAILDRINAELRKEEPDLRHLALTIGSDVGLAAGLISLANSPYFGSRGRARSVNQAMMMLGLHITSRAIAGLVFRQLFPATPFLLRFWGASTGIARVSGWLAKNLDSTSIPAEDAYTFGLFRDCGIAVLINRFREYQTILETANTEAESSFTAIEESAYPTNHAIVGCLLAQEWWLPEEIALAIRHHHEYPPDGALNQSSLNLIAVAQLAEHLYQHHTGLSKTREWEKASTFCLKQLNLQEDSLAQLHEASVSIATQEE